jgi:small subunit ribosomal protein S8
MFLLGDLFARLFSAGNVKKTSISVFSSSFILSVLDLLQDLGFISYYSFFDETKYKVKIYLRYFQGKSVIRFYKLISRPGKRIFVTLNQIKVLNRKGRGFYICSTSKGILTSIECEILGIGGELLLNI